MTSDDFPASEQSAPSAFTRATASSLDDAPPSPPLASHRPDDTADDALDLNALERNALVARHQAAAQQAALAHSQQVAELETAHQHRLADLQAEVSSLNKKLRIQTVRGRQQSGSDQSRVGDLEAQVDALEVELAQLRESAEQERLNHAQQLTHERGIADRALDSARREFREEQSRHVHAHRAALSQNRTELDDLLAEDRAKHAALLEAEHLDYERRSEAERERTEATLAALGARHERELAQLAQAHQNELERQARQHKSAIAGLRGDGSNYESQLQELQNENRALRSEAAKRQKNARQNDADHKATELRLTDQVAMLRAEADAERERNAALRSDVLRRSAEAHQAIDKAVAERTAQLGELEASVTRQREYAESRVREISAASEERTREASAREATLTATISRLKREISELSTTTTRLQQ